MQPELTPEQILEAVRLAFRRDVWRRIDQLRFINQREGIWTPRTEPSCVLLHGNQRVDFFDISSVFRPADRLAFQT